MLQYVWQIAAQAMGPASSEASAWVEAWKAALAHSQQCLFFGRILRLSVGVNRRPDCSGSRRRRSVLGNVRVRGYIKALGP